MKDALAVFYEAQASESDGDCRDIIIWGRRRARVA
jgi:hypothetical protein